MLVYLLGSALVVASVARPIASGLEDIIILSNVYYPEGPSNADVGAIDVFEFTWCPSDIGENQSYVDIAIILNSNPMWDKTQGILVMDVSTSETVFDETTVIRTNYVWPSGLQNLFPEIVFPVAQLANLTALYIRVTAYTAGVAYSFAINFVDSANASMGGQYSSVPWPGNTPNSQGELSKYVSTLSLGDQQVNNSAWTIVQIDFCDTTSWISDVSLVATAAGDASAFNLFWCDAASYTPLSCSIVNNGGNYIQTGQAVISTEIDNDDKKFGSGILFGVYGFGAGTLLDPFNHYVLSATHLKGSSRRRVGAAKHAGLGTLEGVIALSNVYFPEDTQTAQVGSIDLFEFEWCDTDLKNKSYVDITIILTANPEWDSSANFVVVDVGTSQTFDSSTVIATNYVWAANPTLMSEIVFPVTELDNLDQLYIRLKAQNGAAAYSFAINFVQSGDANMTGEYDSDAWTGTTNALQYLSKYASTLSLGDLQVDHQKWVIAQVDFCDSSDWTMEVSVVGTSAGDSSAFNLFYCDMASYTAQTCTNTNYVEYIQEGQSVVIAKVSNDNNKYTNGIMFGVYGFGAGTNVDPTNHYVLSAAYTASK